MSRTVRFAGGIVTAMAIYALLAYGGDSPSHQEGNRLYMTICSGCHGKLEEGAKAGRSMGRIRSAIRVLPSHQEISSSLTDEHLLMIALALKEVPE
jgi:hypothetical protein